MDTVLVSGDPLLSWIDTANKQAIADFINRGPKMGARQLSSGKSSGSRPSTMTARFGRNSLLSPIAACARSRSSSCTKTPKSWPGSHSPRSRRADEVLSPPTKSQTCHHADRDVTVYDPLPSVAEGAKSSSNSAKARRHSYGCRRLISLKTTGKARMDEQIEPRPIATFGGANYSLQMAPCASPVLTPADFGPIVRHTYAGRERAFDRRSSIGKLDKLDVVPAGVGPSSASGKIRRAFFVLQ
jgi:hypothetical protein